MIRINDDIAGITEERLEEMLELMPPWRREVTLRYKRHGSRRESAAAFLLLQDMLREEYGITEPLAFEYGDLGKPHLIGHNDIHFNMSHCRNAVACAVAEHPVGIDIESLGRYRKPLAEYTLSKDEQQLLSHAAYEGLSAEESRDVAFVTLWTKKEALLKLVGTGIVSDLKNILQQYDGSVTFETVVNIPKRYVCTLAYYV